MAGSSQIGALHVLLGLDSAQFTAGAKKAEAALGKFSKGAGVGLAAVAVAATAAAAALGVAAKNAIDHADALSKAAQKAGVTTEALSRLAYAASFSDVSMETLTGSLGKLGKAMADSLITPTSTAAIAFKALGISVKDSSGNLRDTDEVFSDIANRFSRVEDGATKTAIAMAIFGKSGADLIPLLNGGSTELKRFADESDRTGNTITTKAGRAAEKFNDTMAAFSKTIQGIVTTIGIAMLPTLQKFADKLVGLNPEVLKWSGYLVGALAALTPITIGISAAIPALKLMTAGVVALNASLVALVGTLATPGLLAAMAFFASTSPVGKGEDALVRSLGLTNLPKNASGSPDDRDKSGGVSITIHGGSTEDTTPFSLPDLGAVSDSLKAANGPKTFDTAQIDAYRDHMLQLSDTFTKTLDPFEQLKQDFTDLGQLMKFAPSQADKFGEAMSRNIAGVVGDVADLASGYASALSSIFKNNKAIAVAGAVLDAGSAVAKTFATYGATPWGFAAMGLAVAQGVANVASILATNENSTSVTGTGAAAASSASTTGTAGASTNPAIHLTLKGQNFSASQVEDLISQINAHFSDGGSGGSFVTA